MTRRKFANGFIRAGLALQVVFLLLVDWGSIAGMSHERHLPWGHVVGLIAVNAVLLPAAALAWRWVRASANAQPSTGPRA